MAIKCGGTEILQKVWEWVTEKLATEEINNNLLLAKDGEEGNVFHMRAACGILEVLQKEWEWAKEKLTTEVIHYGILFATNAMR